MKKLKRSKNKQVGGVCEGLGKYFDIDPTIFRILFLLTAFIGLGGGLIYLIMWIFVPEED